MIQIPGEDSHIEVWSTAEIEELAHSPFPRIPSGCVVGAGGSHCAAAFNLDYVVVRIPRLLNHQIWRNEYRGSLSLAAYQLPETAGRPCVLVPFYDDVLNADVSNLIGRTGANPLPNAPDFLHTVSTIPTYSGSPIFCLNEGVLLGIHIGRQNSGVDSSAGRGLSMHAILNDLRERYPDVYNDITRPVTSTHSSFPTLLNETPVMNRQFIASVYNDILQNDLFKFANFYGSTDTGKSFCYDLIRHFYHQESTDSVRMFFTNEIGLAEGMDIDERMSEFRELHKDMCSAFGITDVTMPERDSGKYARAMSKALRDLCRQCSEEPARRFIVLIDSESNLLDRAARQVLVVLITHIRRYSNMKMVLFSRKPVLSTDSTMYGELTECCSDSDFQRQSRSYDLDNYKIQVRDVLSCLESITAYLPQHAQEAYRTEVLQSPQDIVSQDLVHDGPMNTSLLELSSTLRAIFGFYTEHYESRGLQ